MVTLTTPHGTFRYRLEGTEVVDPDAVQLLHRINGTDSGDVLLRGSGTEAVSLSTRDSKADACEVDAEMCLEVVQYPIALFFVVFSFF